MTNLSVIEHDGTFVVDSRLIAQELGIEHESFMKTIKKFESKIEQRFGVFRFEIGKPSEGSLGGRPEKYALLTEPQATALMTFSRNTDQVVECKLKLVEAFEKAKKVIKAQQSELEMLRLHNENLKMQLELRHLDNTMLQLHGAPAVLALRGLSDQIVELKTVITEVIDEKTGARFRGATLKQMADILKERFGVKFKSGAEVERYLENIGRHDLLAQMKRPVLCPYIPEEFMDEAIKVLSSTGSRQMLIGE